jgi:transposase
MRLRRPCQGNSAGGVRSRLQTNERYITRNRRMLATSLLRSDRCGILSRHNAVTTIQETPMVTVTPRENKLAALRSHHAANPRPERVTDPAFTAADPFFDARDVVQVKYEMLRRVHHDGQSVSQSARAFGYSRPTFYQAQTLFAQHGLPGLLPQRPGPKRAHKLGKGVVAMVQQVLADDPSLRADALAQMLHDRLGLSVHPRSIERALARQTKKRQGPLP